MSRRSAIRSAVASVIALFLIAVGAAVAQAEPLPADYSGATHGDILRADVDAVGVDAINATLGRSTTAVDSTGAPRSSAGSANLEAGAVGVGVGVETATARSDNANPEDSYNTRLGQVDAAPLLDTGLVSGTGSTRWASDAACVPDGDPIATSTTTLAGATVGLPGVNILRLGTVSTTGETTLDAGSVVSTSAGNLADSTLLNNRVGLHVVNQPQITATSDGATGTVTANDYAVDVTVGDNAAVRLTAGEQLPVDVNVGDVATADLTVTIGALQDNSSGATANGSMSFIHVSGTVDLLGAGQNAVDVDLDLLPLNASAAAPADGVECDTLAAPVITRPADGSSTEDTTPTIAGTGVPGATVTVSEGNTTIGTAQVDEDGTWTLVPDDALDLGAHRIVATQASATATSPDSDPVAFDVVDRTAPDAPVITSPDNGETIADSTPTVTGTGDPGDTVAVSVDGHRIGTTRVGSNGTWRLTVPDALADGQHTFRATQTDAAGNTSPAAAVTATIDATTRTPTITEPTDGSATADSTPVIRGTAEPGATVVVTDQDGTRLGTATANADGLWRLTSSRLAPGAYRISATATDPAGNVSDPSDPDHFTVDTTAPATPVITSPGDGQIIADNTPTITGTGDPGDMITVSVDGRRIGTTEVGTDGTWRLTVPDALADGQHTFRATQTDAAGNTSPAASVTATIDAAGNGAAPTTGAGTGGNGTLASTGSPAGLGAVAAIGLLAVLAGLALVRLRSHHR